MYKKAITACLAVAALAAFALPATASAVSPSLTSAVGGPLVPAGTALKATNVGVTKFTAGFDVIECSTDVLEGTLNKNKGNGEAIEGTIESASFTGTGPKKECTSNLGNTIVTTTVGEGTPWCVKALPPPGSEPAKMELQIRGNSCALKARAITFVFDIGTLVCKYERTAATGPVVGTYNTSPEDAQGTIKPTGSAFAAETGNPFGCPGSGNLEMVFTLKTGAGGETFIS